MNKDEALKMAIDDLELCNGAETVEGIIIYTHETIQACKEALEQRDLYSEIKEGFEALKQPAQDIECSNHPDAPHGFCKDASYSGKTNKEFVLLSDDEIQDAWYKLYPLDKNNLWDDMMIGKHLDKFARAIEAKLKEKNTVTER